MTDFEKSVAIHFDDNGNFNSIEFSGE